MARIQLVADQVYAVSTAKDPESTIPVSVDVMRSGSVIATLNTHGYLVDLQERESLICLATLDAMELVSKIQEAVDEKTRYIKKPKRYRIINEPTTVINLIVKEEKPPQQAKVLREEVSNEEVEPSTASRHVPRTSKSTRLAHELFGAQLAEAGHTTTTALQRAREERKR